jgi:hypothetical protein
MSAAVAVDATSIGTAHIMRFEAFTEEQWQAYQSINRRWPAPIDWDEARRQLEQACCEYSAIETQREERRRSKEYKAALETASRSCGRLRVSLSELEELSPSGSDLDGLPDLGLIEQRLDELSIQYETWSTPFGGRKNRIRETLDNRLLSIWEEQFHGRIRSSKGTSPTPIGPLIRFLSITYKIVLGRWAPGPSGIRSIIEKAKKRKRRPRASRKSGASKRNLRQGQKN